MQIKDVDKLKAWLLKKLEPLCDADPAALAKYVVALLRKEKPKSALKDLCIDQLEVFLAKETTVFVEHLFRCLESESYMKGEDPPPPTSNPKQPTPTPVHPPPTSVRSADKRNSNVVSSPAVSKAETNDRRMSEDFRHKEVDDDDRDFRRSKKHDSETTGGVGSGGGSRKIVAPIVVGSSSSIGGVRSGLSKKRNFNSIPDGGVSSSSKRRVVIDHSRGSESDIHHRTTSGVSSSMGQGGVRRPVRDRLGPRPVDSRSDRGRRGRGGRSSQSSSSSSSSDSDSGSSTTSSDKAVARKRRKTTGSAGGVAKGEGGGNVTNDGKKKQRCKDYDKKGFCILGENCPYDHGLDPLVIGGPYVHPQAGMPPIGVPTLPSQPPPEMLVSSMVSPNISGRHSPTNSKAETYNPEEPGLTSSTSSGFIPTHIVPPPSLPLRPLFPPPHMAGLIPPPHNPHLPMFPPHQHHPFPPINPNPFPHHPRPRPPMGGRGNTKLSDTLIIRKIPKELNTITKLSSHFEKFGTIVNLTVRYEGDLEGALIQFSSHAEAKKAHDNTEAVLNNRFIKIYYLRKDDSMPPPPLKQFTLEAPVSVALSTIHPEVTTPSSSGAGSVSTGSVSSSETVPTVQPTPDSSGGGVVELEQPVQQRSVAPSASNDNTIRNTNRKNVPTTTSSSTYPSQPHRPKHHQQQQQKRSTEVAKKNLELQKKAQELLQKQIEQQKLLISKLEETGKQLSAEEKNQIMKNLKTLSLSITKLAEVANKAVLSQKQEQHLNSLGQDQKVEKAEGQQGVKPSLKEKADALRKEAHKLGLLSSPSQPLPTAGRGKGKNSLDLRSKLYSKPRQLLVIGAKERDQLITYFESFGGLDSVEIDPASNNNLIFTFRNSSTANQVVKSSSMFKGKPLIMKWYTPKSHSSLNIPTATTALTSTPPSLSHQNADVITKPTSIPTSVENQDSETPPPITPTLTKLDPQELHLVEDSEDEEDAGEERSWRR